MPVTVFAASRGSQQLDGLKEGRNQLLPGFPLPFLILLYRRKLDKS